MPTFYVTKHESASDSNGGTNATTDAWATANKGFTSIEGEDTLKFGTGTYDVDRSTTITGIASGSSGSPTIITDNGDGVVTFNHPGSGAVNLIRFDGASPRKEYISFIGTSAGQLVFDAEDLAACSTAVSVGGGSPASSCPRFITFTNAIFKNSIHSGVLTGHSEDITFDNCDFVHNGSFAPGESVPQYHGVYGVGARLVIKNCRSYDNYGWGMHIYSGSSPNYLGREIYNNWVYNNGYGNGTTQVGGSGILVNSGGCELWNNLCFKNDSSGIDVWRTSTASIYHNTCHENGGYGVRAGRSSGSTTNLQVKNNILLDNDSGTVRLDPSCTSAVVTWNRGDSAISNGGSGTTASNNATDGVVLTEWVDPTNATLASRDYNLKVGAASIAPGAPSVGITADIEGTARNFIDQGAYAYGSTTPPDPPIIGHDGSYVVTHEWTDITLTVTKGTNNVVHATISGTGNASLSATPTNVTVVRNT